MFLHRLSKLRAPEFPDGLRWLQGGNLSIKSLRGRVVLIEFWTYSCANCLRTLPHLKRWHELYADKGLTVIGVHTPEFEFEKEPNNVARAVADHDLRYPIVLDSDYKLWQLFGNQYWPRQYLINKDGYIVFDHIGEGNYAKIELAIQKALKEVGSVELPKVPPHDDGNGGICYRTTAETYLGFLRGELGNQHDYLPDEEQVFEQAEVHSEGLPILYGHWKVAGQFIQHTRKLAIASEYIALQYNAFSVNLVMATTDGRTAMLEVELDGLPLPQDMAGRDVRIDAQGKATVIVKDSRLYNLVNAKMYHRGTLKLKTPSANLQMFAFTFGGCEE
jgi:thiol-disulfide isomerase/thioredoxin